ncbi:LRR receptor-like serine/threonine-protein kinase GSO2 [Selaginella moellendorffii]|uniref:LRR receptor-like serine/threonine-protein kinase GSO2 n=1 Tax=Selaginella moellendorffii TaxID=88036 RepID=UPI000D1C4BBE|nr:LRR receptor-like serine/threonine-protein kinase GSO2 [Selaginella moellendorffii]|eukprot:XP_024531074.1 LRR receptor-like serine/threonine-protein kinase GSO2 [Selaginella moellendorffii]
MEVLGYGGLPALVVSWIFFFSRASSQFLEADALLEFKRSVVPSGGGGALADWSAGSRQLVCNWTGITCDGGGRSGRSIARIDLGGLQIGASVAMGDQSVNIAPLLGGGLRGLVFLNLSANLLRGALPPSLELCSPSIATLDLSSNGLGGAIPPSLGNCSGLQELDLSHNNLTGGLPASMANLSSLATFAAEENNLTGEIPSFIGELGELQLLNLIGNSFSGGIPPSLANCSRLQFLFLFRNAITGEIPPSLGRLQSLKTLGLDNNFLSGPIPPSLANCSSLSRILLYYNNITGEVPLEIARIRGLFTLELTGNQLTGSLEDFPVGHLQNLTYVSFAANAFRGGIPGSITNCSKLINMDFSRNSFSGEIPHDLGRLQSLRSLRLHDNQLTGGVPPEIGSLNASSFQGLFLQRNKLEGVLPAEISSCKSLVEMDLSGNLLSGSIPRELCGLSNLEHMNLSRNSLGGGIPDCLNACFKLTLLDLSSNLFAGTIPRSLLNFPSMALGFSLAGNRLQGTIPEEIGIMTMVEKINLSGNNLSGGIPRGISKCVQLDTLDLSSNELSGLIPDELGQLSSLQGLDLSNNRLTGKIPVFLAKLQKLEHLNLSSNNFSGEIPSFANISAASFEGNPELCGRIIAKPCTTTTRSRDHHKKRKLLLALAIGAPVLLAATIASFICCFSWRPSFLRAKSISEAAQELDDQLELSTTLREFSVAELWDATDGYAAQNILGVTATSTVYKATLLDGSAAAVKRFKDLLSDSISSNLFTKELRIILSIRHRNLVKTLGYCRNRSLVLDFMPNGSLEMQLHKTPCKLTWAMRLDIALGTAQALAYLHESCDPPVVHCDLKPSNILLDADYEAHVADFGISKLLETSEEIASVSLMLRGTLGYIPPEYGYASKPSVRGDVYSFGVILLELITGLAPTNSLFHGGTIQGWVSSCWPDEFGAVVDRSMGLTKDNWMEVEQAINLGLLCSSHSYMERPLMGDVEAVLRRIRSGGSSSTRKEMTLDDLAKSPGFVIKPR